LSLSTKIINLPSFKGSSLYAWKLYISCFNTNGIKNTTTPLQLVVDNAKVAAETKAYQKIPEVLSFTDANDTTTKEQVEANYRQIKLDVVEIIEREKERIANDPELRYLVEKEGE